MTDELFLVPIETDPLSFVIDKTKGPTNHVRIES